MDNIITIAEGLTEAGFSPADFLQHYDMLCDADPLPCDYDEYLKRMEGAKYIECVPVDDDALESAFAWDRGIVPGGMMLQLTPLGLALRSYLQRQST